ncbi:MAG: hypothetical protein M1831_000672 [Alyxoria varia]|nr:MAG: hypothetical protein M1831_000672 [Alyxoria varia]
MDSFDEARQSFLANLKSQERTALNATDPASLLEDVKNLEEDHKDSNITRRLLQKAKPFIRGLEQYGKALDVISNAKPEIMCLLRGGARIILNLARSYLDVFDKLLAHDKVPSINVRDALKPTRTSLKKTFLSAIDRLVEIINFVKEDASLAEKEAAVEARNRDIADAQYPVDSNANYEAAMKLCEPGTGQWIFQTDEFRGWASSENGPLWLHAKPGAGKTVLASTVITYLRQHYLAEDTIVAYYFFDYKDVKTQTPLKMFQTLLAEMCRQSPDILESMSSLSKKYQELNSNYSTALMRQMLLDRVAAANIKQTYIVVDALDESSDRMQLLEQLHHVIGTGSRVKLLMSSREEHDLEASLRNLPRLSLYNAGNTEDITLYIDHQLERLISSGALKFRNPNLKNDIRDTLSAKADGMFQYVNCQLESLRDTPSDKWIRDLLNDLPIGLDETYIRILQQIRVRFSREVQIIRKILFWLVHSMRPLSGHELAEAAFFSTDCGFLDFDSIPVSPHVLLQYSGGLYRAVDDSDTIALAHFSVKTFLLSSRCQQSSVNEFFCGDASMLPSLTMHCLHYLKLSDFSSGQCFTRKQLSMRIKKYRFLLYAADEWMNHYQLLPESAADECDASVLESLIQPRWEKNLLAWQQILMHTDSYPYLGYTGSLEVVIIHLLDPIHHAAAHLLWRLTRLLLQNGSDPNSPGGAYGHPILTAANSGRIWAPRPQRRWRYIYDFLELDANIVVGSRSRELAREFSASWTPEYLEILPKLVSRGIFGNHQEDLEIILAGVTKHPGDSQDAVQFILDHGANDNYCYSTGLGRDMDPTTRPLQSACEADNQSVATLLLARGADLNFSQTDTGTALQAAVVGGSANMVKWLLKRHADPNSSGGALGTPLQAAAWYGRTDLVQILIDGGAKVDAPGGFFGSALTAATADGNEEVIYLILRRQPDCNGGEPAYNPMHYRLNLNKRLPDDMSIRKDPLIWTIEHGNMDLTNRLIDSGAILNPHVNCVRTQTVEFKRNSGFHPLCAAILNKNLQIVDLLLEKGSECSLGDFCAVRSAA